MKIILCTYNTKLIHMNLALRYLKANLQNHSMDAKIIEFTIKDPVFHAAAKILTEKPTVIAFSCYLWNIELILKTVHIIKKAAPQIQIILGGPEVSFDGEQWLEKEKGIDIIIEGEGEITFSEIVQALSDHKPLSHVRGIVYRDVNNVFHRTGKRPPVDVKQLKSPYRFVEDIENLDKRIVYFETNRGCPFNCHFCLSSTEQGVRFFDMNERKQELLFLIKSGAKTIKFLDRTFNTNIRHALDIFSFLIEHHRPGNVFQFEITGDIMKSEVIDYLNQNAPKGLFRFEIGVQSTHNPTNQLVNRHQNFETLRNNILRIQSGGKIDLHLDLIAGLPQEDYTRFQKTFNDVFALRPAELQFGFLKMLRGTPLRNKADQHHYVYADFPPYEIISNDVLSFDDLLKMKQTEDVLEKYWNSGKLRQSVIYCIDFLFKNAWDFFYSFGAFWHKQKWSTIGHQHFDLFQRLLTFIDSYAPNHRIPLETIMLLDYYDHYQYKPKRLKTLTLTKEEKKLLLDKLSMHLAADQILPNKNFDLKKHTQIEHAEIDLVHWMQNKEIKMKQQFYCIVYHPIIGKILKYCIDPIL